ncbi:3-keto-5-aminohexanoate cleavage protein [Plantactinospora siamensis]|uniref:3-keto-5-aminohexanoate cleavage protein n=1 Tax=Plantactinospora siamensis TaxID=555372 RepID=A0ABV6NSK7_9ACTN
MLKVCLNGGRSRRDHPAVPVTAAELAADAARCVAAGADAVHLHPRGHDEAETLDAAYVAAAVSAVRAACPGTPVGVTTGAWIAPDPAARVAAVRGWTTPPDFASVNAHEPGAEAVAAALHELGVGVEAGLWTPDAVIAYRRWRVPVDRILLECLPDGSAGAQPAPGLDGGERRPDDPAVGQAEELLSALGVGAGGRDPAAPAVLLHAEGPGTWPVLRLAVRLGLHTRIGLEDTTELPDGSPAPDNAALVAAAVALGAG